MENIADIIKKEIENFNETLTNKIDVSHGEDSVIWGQGSSLESVDFVSLMLDIEQAVNDKFDSEIVIVDARAMSQKKSPFRTIGTLAAYIKSRLEEDSHA